MGNLSKIIVSNCVDNCEECRLTEIFLTLYDFEILLCHIYKYRKNMYFKMPGYPSNHRSNNYFIIMIIYMHIYVHIYQFGRRLE